MFRAIAHGEISVRPQKHDELRCLDVLQTTVGYAERKDRLHF